MSPLQGRGLLASWRGAVGGSCIQYSVSWMGMGAGLTRYAALLCSQPAAFSPDRGMFILAAPALPAEAQGSGDGSRRAARAARDADGSSSRGARAAAPPGGRPADASLPAAARHALFRQKGVMAVGLERLLMLAGCGRSGGSHTQHKGGAEVRVLGLCCTLCLRNWQGLEGTLASRPTSPLPTHLPACRRRLCLCRVALVS